MTYEEMYYLARSFAPKDSFWYEDIVQEAVFLTWQQIKDKQQATHAYICQAIWYKVRRACDYYNRHTPHLYFFDDTKRWVDFGDINYSYRDERICLPLDGMARKVAEGMVLTNFDLPSTAEMLSRSVGNVCRWWSRAKALLGNFYKEELCIM